MSSRLSNLSRNGLITLIFFVANTFLSFFARKIMLTYLGTDLLGLNTTLSAIIDFMLLMELGVTSAIGVSLYKPLAQGDTEKINEIIWLIKYLYRLLSIGIFTVGLLFSPLLPFIVEKSTVTLPQTYIAYFVFLTCSCSNYFFGYGRVLFQADQKNYIPVTVTNVVLMSKTIAQIIIIARTGSYWWWLAIELFFQVLAYFCIEKFLYRHYRILQSAPGMKFKELIKKYRDIFQNAKRIAVHHLSGFVLRQSDNIIIATMINLSTVAMYGNYLMVNSALNNLIWNVTQNAWAGVGNLVATENKGKIYSVYKEYLSINFLIAVILNLSIIFLIQDFIKVWIGPEYLLPYSIILALTGVNLIGSLTNATAAFVVAHKLFGFIRVPVMEAIINIILSVIGVYYFGLLGVILGTLGSTLLSTIWKPIYLHYWGLRLPMRGFLAHIAKLFGFLILTILVINFCVVLPVRHLLGEIRHLGDWLLMATIVFTSIVIIFTGLLYLGDSSFRGFLYRFKKRF